MSRDQFLRFRESLLQSRREILDRVKGLQSRWNEMSEPAIELEEEAQRATLTLPYDRLDETGKDTIEKIDLALNKLITGDYGVCEHCGEDISLKRLEAMPWARLCIDCAREFERKQQVLPTPVEIIEGNELPDEYQGLSNNQILKIIHDQIETDGRIDTEELAISLRDGVLYLEGTVGGEPERQILVQIITDVLGFSAVVDHLSTSDVVFEREDRTPDKKGSRGSTMQDKLFYDQEDLEEDLFEAGDDKSYHPPEEPLPQQEYEPRRPYDRHRENTI